MMLPVIRWTLWQRRWSVFWWCAGIVAFISLELGVYSSIRGQAQQLNKVLDRLPDSVRALMGGSNDLFSPVGYLNSRLFYLLLPLMLSILAIGLGSSLVVREETSGTLELILARPISRTKLLLAKAISGFLVILTVWSAALVSTLILVRLVDLKVTEPKIAFAAFMAGLLAVLFGALAYFVAALGSIGRGASIGFASLVALGGYIITSLENNVHWLAWPAKFFPYHYYNTIAILNGQRPWGPAVGFGLIIIGLIVLSWLAFRRRDLNG